MLIISQLRMGVDHSDDALKAAVARTLKVPESAIRKWSVDQRAIDARRGQVEFTYSILVDINRETEVVARCQDKRVAIAPDCGYWQLDSISPSSAGNGRKVVIVGSGPCGLACGLMLARYGWKPVILERGKAAGDRARDVMSFWKRQGGFDPNSNVQFGEGGAGTFSDGKLYTQIRDRENRIPWLLKEFVRAGAPEDILIKSRPHVGTDRLIKVVRTMREEIIALGGEVKFGAHVTGVAMEKGRMTSVQLADGITVSADAFVFAIGHSARDTFEMLHEAGIPFEAKPFAVGVRIEHPQRVIDRAQYARLAGHPRLGAAPYRFVAHCPSGRSAYSFCMCPGGLVVASTSEPNQVVTNGMSSYARAESNANSGFMVELKPSDFPEGGPLEGIKLQRELEHKAFELGGGNYFAPAQKLGDFMKGLPSTGPGKILPSYLPGVKWTDLSLCLPQVVTETLREAIPIVERQLPGFSIEDAVLTGVETRSSSPVRIPRDPETLECPGVEGFYPAGEGAGYAGGIVSAAVDGIRIAERLLLGK